MGCCFGRTNAGAGSHTGYVLDADDTGECTCGRFLCCFFCCCIYPCLPYKGGGSYPHPLKELNDFTLEQEQLDQDEVEAYYQLQKERIDNHEPIALTFDDIVNRLETGDIVLFHGTSFLSNLIAMFTGRWTHAGVAYVKIINVKCERTGRITPTKVILLFETVGHHDECIDVTTNTYREGVRLVDLKKRLMMSDSPYFGIVKIHVPSKRRPQMERAFENFYASEGWKAYEPNPINLVRVALDCGALGHNEADNRSYFCSKLVCETLEHLGIIDRHINSARVSPTDFWDYRLRLKNDCRIKSLIYLPRIQDVPSVPMVDPEPTAAATALPIKNQEHEPLAHKKHHRHHHHAPRRPRSEKGIHKLQ